MAIIMKLNLLDELSKKGYYTYLIEKDGLLTETTLKKLQNWEIPSYEELDKICELLDAQPGDLVGHITNEDRDKILDRINKESKDFKIYAEDTLIYLVSEDLDYPIYSKIYEDLRDYIDDDLEISEIVEEILDNFDFLHKEMAEDDWKRLRHKYKASLTNKAKRLIEYALDMYEKAYEEAYNGFIDGYVRGNLEKEAPSIIGDVDYYSSYDEEDEEA